MPGIFCWMNACYIPLIFSILTLIYHSNGIVEIQVWSSKIKSIVSIKSVFKSLILEQKPITPFITDDEEALSFILYV